MHLQFGGRKKASGRIDNAASRTQFQERVPFEVPLGGPGRCNDNVTIPQFHGDIAVVSRDILPIVHPSPELADETFHTVLFDIERYESTFLLWVCRTMVGIVPTAKYRFFWTGRKSDIFRSSIIRSFDATNYLIHCIIDRYSI